MKLVEKTPLLTTFLLEGANVGQMVRMCRERSAEGQSLTSWLMVWLALAAWINFYARTMPKGGARTFAIVGTAIGLTMNTFVILTVVYFRWVA